TARECTATARECTATARECTATARECTATARECTATARECTATARECTVTRYSVRGRLSACTTPMRLQAKTWAHFPIHIPPTEKKKKILQKGVLCATQEEKV
ncbi:hypothetical protein AVEN_233484-1, partial [Araneus ventricosus]